MLGPLLIFPSSPLSPSLLMISFILMVFNLTCMLVQFNVSSPYLASDLQKHLFNRPLNFSAWTFHMHIQFHESHSKVCVPTINNTEVLFSLYSFSFWEMTAPTHPVAQSKSSSIPFTFHIFLYSWPYTLCSR